jgi:hypothetical protein
LQPPLPEFLSGTSVLWIPATLEGKTEDERVRVMTMTRDVELVEVFADVDADDDQL